MKLLLLDIDGAGERDSGDINSENLADEIRKRSGHVEMFAHVQDLVWHAQDIFCQSDFVITAGVGSISGLAGALAELKGDAPKPLPGAEIGIAAPGRAKRAVIGRNGRSGSSEATVLTILLLPCWQSTITRQPRQRHGCCGWLNLGIRISLDLHGDLNSSLSVVACPRNQLSY